MATKKTAPKKGATKKEAPKKETGAKSNFVGIKISDKFVFDTKGTTKSGKPLSNIIVPPNVVVDGKDISGYKTMVLKPVETTYKNGEKAGQKTGLDYINIPEDYSLRFRKSEKQADGTWKVVDEVDVVATDFKEAMDSSMAQYRESQKEAQEEAEVETDTQLEVDV